MGLRLASLGSLLNGNRDMSDQDHIELKLPYDGRYIEGVRNAAKQAGGYIKEIKRSFLSSSITIVLPRDKVDGFYEYKMTPISGGSFLSRRIFGPASYK